MFKIKENALKELEQKLINSDIEHWQDGNTNIMYNWYLGNEYDTNISKYARLITYKEFKYQVDQIINEIKEERINDMIDEIQKEMEEITRV